MKEKIMIAVVGVIALCLLVSWILAKNMNANTAGEILGEPELVKQESAAEQTPSSHQDSSLFVEGVGEDGCEYFCSAVIDGNNATFDYHMMFNNEVDADQISVVLSDGDVETVKRLYDYVSENNDSEYAPILGEGITYYAYSLNIGDDESANTILGGLKLIINTQK